MSSAEKQLLESGEGGAQLRALPPRRDFCWWIFLAWLAALGIARLTKISPVPLPECGLLKLTGIPCPLCGSTRSLIAWSSLDIQSAFLLNPLVAFGGVVVCLWSIVWFSGKFFGHDWAARLWTRFARLPLARIFAALLFVNWVYLFFLLPR
jgi:hypothetical protein